MFPSEAVLYMAPIAVAEGAEVAESSSSFWADLKDWYKVDLSPLSSYAKTCHRRCVQVQTVNPSLFMAHKTKLCHLDLSTVSAEQLHRIEVCCVY